MSAIERYELEWHGPAYCEYQKMTPDLDGIWVRADDAIPRIKELELALQNCMALANRPGEPVNGTWREHVLRFCAGVGIKPSILRDLAQPEIGRTDASELPMVKKEDSPEDPHA